MDILSADALVASQGLRANKGGGGRTSTLNPMKPLSPKLL